MRTKIIWTVTWLALVLAGCATPEKSPRGFRLPDGDAERGRVAFVELKCHSCHQIEGMAAEGWGTALVQPVILGGEVLYVRTDGELVTAIVNPSHKIAKGYPQEVTQIGGRSRMKDYADEMTMRQLIDIVAFLHTRYRAVPPPTGHY